MKNIKLVLFAVLLISFTSQFLHAQPLQEFRGVKITNVDSYVMFTDKGIASAMDYLSSIGVNTVLVVVLNGGYTTYPSAVMQKLFNKPIIPQFAGRDPLDRILIEAHRNGIEVLPWFEYGFCPSYSNNGGFILQKFPSWGTKDNKGNLCVKNGFDWMSGINPEVQDFIISIATEIIDNYDVDGIEFSDRCPALPVEGGYDSVTVSIYKSEHNNQAPPSNFRDAEWMRWRANKMNDWYKRVRDSVKIRDKNLFVDSSPNAYPWCYDEYLADSKTWLDSAIVDNLLPQFYRKDFSEYYYELNKALSYVPFSKRSKFFSAMLLNVGDYVSTTDLMLKSIKANRDNGVQGEVLFFYEGLRKNSNELGEALKNSYYSKPALVPGRNGRVWRPKGIVVNEDDNGAVKKGSWKMLPAMGYKQNIIVASDSVEASIDYIFQVPASGWYSLYIYGIPDYNNTTAAPCTVFASGDSTVSYFNMKESKNGGWQKLKNVYLEAGERRVLSISNKNIEKGKNIIADAAMLILNRKLSPDVLITSVKNEINKNLEPENYKLKQNYPNPFNPATTIEFAIPQNGKVTIKLYDVLGRHVTTLLDNYCEAGSHKINFDASRLSSGVYFYQLAAKNYTSAKKMVLAK